MSAVLADVGPVVSPGPRAPLVLPLTDALDATQAGGKAATLARLSALGVNVPAGFVLTTAAFEAHIAAAGLADRITTLVQELDVHDTELLTGTSRAIRALVQQQVEAHTAGVMFTDAGDRSLLIEYGAGLATALVAGEIDPGRASITRDGSVRTLATLGGDATRVDAMLRDPARARAFVAI